MRLFTSNSKTGLIAGALLGALVLMAFYQVIVMTHRLPASDGINQWEENQIRAQRYALQTEPTIGPVMVGSSLTASIKPDYVGPNVTSLGMSGGSVSTGLELVARSHVRPSVVIAELQDPIIRPIDDTLVNDAAQPWLCRLREKVPILRREYQPVSVIVYFVKNLRKHQMSDEQLDQASGIDADLHTLLVKERVADNQKLLTDAEAARFHSAANLVRAQIARLNKRGIAVALHTIPQEPVVQQTPRQKQIHDLLRTEFPESQYTWLPEPPMRDWATRDGEHLIRPDAKIYGQFLGTQITRELASKRLAARG